MVLVGERTSVRVNSTEEYLGKTQNKLVLIKFFNNNLAIKKLILQIYITIGGTADTFRQSATGSAGPVDTRRYSANNS